MVDMSHRHAIAYTRVSTGRQADSGLSLDDQLDRCTAAVAARGWTLAAHITDAGASGRRAENRPGLVEARRMLAAGEADALVVAKMDRLARSVIDTARILEDARRE
jgi:DNA invertase Pin-like site-specific DNA recombinase